ncbi:hypothetical protein ADK67_46460 [Saccharothrix sp. NRRL B-16348]|uniref:hypothetical protein n=1 Tax=Saccharothrix sp. NRRL B-16348 TaxID=1415542 RepID=UPI0006AF13CC|nr:hypothetical protein [Saccharothrix sp. NRRL B-16348]KOX12681.1 hypothetical protein ADK67_46460 [Saccharothrix sp. NRRL B-16348]
MLDVARYDDQDDQHDAQYVNDALDEAMEARLHVQTLIREEREVGQAAERIVEQGAATMHAALATAVQVSLNGRRQERLSEEQRAAMDLLTEKLNRHAGSLDRYAGALDRHAAVMGRLVEALDHHASELKAARLATLGEL